MVEYRLMVDRRGPHGGVQVLWVIIEDHRMSSRSDNRVG